MPTHWQCFNQRVLAISRMVLSMSSVWSVCSWNWPKKSVVIGPVSTTNHSQGIWSRGEEKLMLTLYNGLGECQHILGCLHSWCLWCMTEMSKQTCSWKMCVPFKPIDKRVLFEINNRGIKSIEMRIKSNAGHCQHLNQWYLSMRQSIGSEWNGTVAVGKTLLRSHSTWIWQS